MSRFTCAHNDYLDPDKYGGGDGGEPPDWYEDMLDNCQEFMDEFSTKSWGEFYRIIYKNSACGPSIGVMLFDGIEQEGIRRPVYCEQLYKVPASAPVDRVYVSSIIEGSEATTSTIEVDMTKPGALKRFWEALEDIEKEAQALWDDNNIERDDL